MVAADKTGRLRFGEFECPNLYRSREDSSESVFPFQQSSRTSVDYHETGDWNQESLVFQRVRARMALFAVRCLSFLNEMYSSEDKGKGSAKGGGREYYSFGCPGADVAASDGFPDCS